MDSRLNNYMKKTALILIGILIFAFKTDTEKKYKFELNEVQLNALWNCIDNSNAPHTQVKEVEALIQNQLKEQLPKPPVDSTKTKK